MQSQAAHNPNTSAVQLDKWSRELAPLSDGARSSVNTLADWINKSLDGHKQDASAASAPRQSREDVQQDARMDISERTPRPSSPAQDTATAQPEPRTQDSLARPSLPTAPISDAPAFLSWYNAQQSHIASSSSSHHQDTIRALGEARERADETLSQLEAARIHVAELRAGAKFVQEGSEGLREEAESMAEKMDHLSTLSDELALRLSYFAILPSSTTFLSSPSLSLVLSPDFLYTLDRLDVGLQFLRAHPDYHDAAVYKMRFEHCVVRAGQLIRLHVTSTFKSVVGETLVKLKEWERSRWSKAGEKETQDQNALMDLADPVLHTLLYDRFNEEAQQMKPLLLELEKRSAPSAPAAASLDVSNHERDKQPPMDENALLADYAAKAKVESTEGDAAALQEDSASAAVFSAPEFDAMLMECRTAYFEARQTLLSGIVGSCVARIEAAAQTLASATASTSRAHASLLPPLVRQGLAFLAPVCESERSLYGRFFATQTAAEATFLSTLCGPLHDRVCSRVQRENNVAIVSQVCVALLEPADRLEHTALLSPLIRPMLKDAQAQLSMRARTLSLGPEIANFKPSADDLDYPTKLGGAAAAAHRRAQSSIGGAGLLEAAAEAEAARSRGASEASRDSKMGLARAQQEGNAATTSVRLFASPAPSVVRTWYTPVSRTLTMLSLLHIALPTKLFCELAMIAVDACRHALLHGAERMGSDGNSMMPGRIGATGRMDPPLFLLRHFLLLREMVASAELSTSAQGQGQPDRMAVALGDGNALQHSSSVIDFALLTSVVNALWATTSALLDPRGLLRGVASVDEEPALNRTRTPRSPSGPVDPAQSEALTRLEDAIKSASAQLVDVISSSVCLPVRVFMDQARRPKVAVPASPTTKPSKMSADKIKGAKEAFDTCARTTLSEVKLALAAYIEEERVIDSLVEPILTRIVQTYQAFVDVVQENTANAASEQQAPEIIPSPEEVQRELRKLIQR
ncbi:hypothetical protein IE81DRAFT_369517 [Ceraceosorus guamensis]|uniref:Conserved oligomeric Golgi complex subunit 3 n=1 Tax=Ceraceosorus guamensis TaxID=1522189 RepID=A0A316VTQ5_9BASI|nr:hypothetical protein IE81DRAFT_369517 [Ceraceosorus guamensis]PWN38875.1 hypothetical protein IE81DRAFT_369517 [Ceraceosorus guamensis]